MGSQYCKPRGSLCDPCKSDMKSTKSITLCIASEDILEDPEKLKAVIKTQAVIKGKIVRELVKRKRVQKRMSQLGEFDYGDSSPGVQKNLVYRDE